MSENVGSVADPPFRVGEAIRFAWERFTGNALLWILFVLLLIVVSSVFNSANITSSQEAMQGGWSLPFDTDPSSVSAMFDVGWSLGSLSGLVGAVLAGIVQGMGTSAALSEVDGARPRFASLFQPANLGMIVLAALLLVAAETIGILLCGVGLIVVAIFAVFTYHGVIDHGLNAWVAFTESFRLVGKNFGTVFLLELSLLGLNILGVIPCLLGLLITIPLSFIALSFAYRRLTAGPVAG